MNPFVQYNLLQDGDQGDKDMSGNWRLQGRVLAGYPPLPSPVTRQISDHGGVIYELSCEGTGRAL